MCTAERSGTRRQITAETRYLVRVGAQVEILQETSSKFTEQEVVCVIDGPQAPVGVVVGTGARAERTHWARGGGGGGKERTLLLFSSHLPGKKL